VIPELRAKSAFQIDPLFHTSAPFQTPVVPFSPYVACLCSARGGCSFPDSPAFFSPCLISCLRPFSPPPPLADAPIDPVRPCFPIFALFSEVLPPVSVHDTISCLCFVEGSTFFCPYEANLSFLQGPRSSSHHNVRPSLRVPSRHPRNILLQINLIRFRIVVSSLVLSPSKVL